MLQCLALSDKTHFKKGMATQWRKNSNIVWLVTMSINERANKQIRKWGSLLWLDISFLKGGTSCDSPNSPSKQVKEYL